ncbi:MAG: 30S ribosomal protein S13 [Candidatus Ryanbacteria bacterium RIFCSPLOWO2_02_FULL_45_11c]|uniref:Small ribosomal subunit protein uS13 n=1 Tax=Candidatus Ryanbacteria bacterium RIFCSPLOWO2_02_FULL_45_11c TaxID=1802128 RepID=A0A1G2H1Y7_9BACT|nr:MAG: 30S ribosomal protein S13 [Candidatus Ryanbacteria bacterium RIFCSPLOWO2_02_FULL_45_11c]
MARITGVTIPDDKKVYVALTYIYGIGNARARNIVQSTKIDGTKHIRDLSNDELVRIRDIIEKTYKVEGDLRREVAGNIKRLKDTGTYRGARHIKGLPVRGQRTRTNSRTRRGNVRHTATSGKRTVDKK